MRRALPLLIAAAIITVSPAAARQREDGKISTRLVALLFPGMAETIVEGMPEGLPDVLPDGATALVSTTSPYATTVIAEVSSFTPAERPRYERKLAAGGWREGSGPQGGGGGLMASTMQIPKMFCREGQLLSFSDQPRPGGGSLFRLSLMKTGPEGPCGRYSGPPRSHSPFDDIDLPPLPPPPGSRQMEGSSGGGSVSLDQAARLETSLSAEDVEAHYTALLTAHGWTAGPRISGEGFSLSRLVPLLDPDAADKTPRTATFEAVSLPGGDVAVTLRVFRPRRGWQ